MTVFLCRDVLAILWKEVKAMESAFCYFKRNRVFIFKLLQTRFKCKQKEKDRYCSTLHREISSGKSLL